MMLVVVSNTSATRPLARSSAGAAYVLREQIDERPAAQDDP